MNRETQRQKIQVSHKHRVLCALPWTYRFAARNSSDNPEPGGGS